MGESSFLGISKKVEWLLHFCATEQIENLILHYFMCAVLFSKNVLTSKNFKKAESALRIPPGIGKVHSLFCILNGQNVYFKRGLHT